MSRMVSLMTAAIGCRSVDVIAEVMTRRCMPNDSSDWQWAVLRSCPQEPRCMWDSALAYEQCAVDNPVVIYLEFQLQSQPSPSFLSSDRPHFVIFILRTSQQSWLSSKGSSALLPVSFSSNGVISSSPTPNPGIFLPLTSLTTCHGISQNRNESSFASPAFWINSS